MSDFPTPNWHRRPDPWAKRPLRPSWLQRAARAGLFGHFAGFISLIAVVGAAGFYADNWYPAASRMIPAEVGEMAGRTIQFVTGPSSHETVSVHAPDRAPVAVQRGAPPIRPSVLDGDTIRLSDQTYRLVGFNTPETGGQARCERESALGRAATQRLRELVAAGSLDFARVPCACPSGTEGTRECNYGRLCGTLRSHGRDVGGILIAEGLAHPYNCRGTSCPRRQSWCG